MFVSVHAYRKFGRRIWTLWWKSIIKIRSVIFYGHTGIRPDGGGQSSAIRLFESKVANLSNCSYWARNKRQVAFARKRGGSV